jgi:hypothetical protein
MIGRRPPLPATKIPVNLSKKELCGLVLVCLMADVALPAPNSYKLHKEVEANDEALLVRQAGALCRL